MRTKRFTRLPGLAFAILFTLLIGQGPVVGHDDSKGAKADRIEGVWDDEVIIIDCATGESTGREFPSTIMFMHGGQLIETPGTPLGPPMLPSQGPPPPPIPIRRGHVGLGSWHHLGGRHYTAAFRCFRFIADGSAADGSFAGIQEITEAIELSEDGDEFTTTGTSHIKDGNGSTQDGCNTLKGTRRTVPLE
jgi:hypothetical protein